MAQSYNDTASVNGKVQKTGDTPESAAGKAPSASNSNPANVQTDGTASPRVTTQTFQAPANSTPSGGKTEWPDIDSFSDGAV
jgi:hypothetical protein